MAFLFMGASRIRWELKFFFLASQRHGAGLRRVSAITLSKQTRGTHRAAGRRTSATDLSSSSESPAGVLEQNAETRITRLATGTRSGGEASAPLETARPGGAAVVAGEKGERFSHRLQVRGKHLLTRYRERTGTSHLFLRVYLFALQVENFFFLLLYTMFGNDDHSICFQRPKGK